MVTPCFSACKVGVLDKELLSTATYKLYEEPEELPKGVKVGQLTVEQIQELQWFCKNVAGTKREFYDLYDQVKKYKRKIDRLHDTRKLIEEYLEIHESTMETP